MVFGISRLIKSLSLSSIFHSFKRQIIYSKNKGKELKIGLACGIHNVSFGMENFIGEKTSLINTSVGDNSYINTYCRIRDCKIGKFCSIASDVTIGLGTHPTNLVSLHPTFYSNNKKFNTFSDKTYFQESFPTEIGNDVWIGKDVMIPGGVKIGNGAIIAARAVVTKDVLPYEIVGGIPAKHIKFRFSENEIELLEKYKWWNKDKKWLMDNYLLFHSPKQFFQVIKEELSSNLRNFNRERVNGK